LLDGYSKNGFFSLTNTTTMYGAQTNDHQDGEEGKLSYQYIGGRGIFSIVDENPDLNNMVLVATSGQIKRYRQRTSYIEMPFISFKKSIGATDIGAVRLKL
jgi:hypothetical protein